MYDLEVSPTLGWTYGLYDTRVIRTQQEPFIMSFSYRWYGERKTHFVRTKVKDMNQVNEDEVARQLRDLFDEADIVVAHNARKFDNKIATAAFVRHGIEPPSPYKTVDTLQVARSVMRVNSNSLDNLGELLKVGRKTSATHADLWYRCLLDEKKAWKDMEKYNNQDVKVLYGIYEKLRPYMTTHPNVAMLNGKVQSCPKCGKTNLQSRGTRITNAAVYQRYQCQDCGGWCSARKQDKVEKTSYVNYT